MCIGWTRNIFRVLCFNFLRVCLSVCQFFSLSVFSFTYGGTSYGSKVYYAPCTLFGGSPQFSGLGSLIFGRLGWFGLLD